MEEQPIIEPKPKVKANARGYKHVALYDPNIKKSKVVAIKISDFDSAEELNAYCQKLKNDNKIKNAEWRRNQRREAMKLVVNKYEENGNNLQLTDIDKPPTTRVKIDLDKKTGNTIVIFGSSKRGKSTLMMYLYKKYFKSPDNINTLYSGNPHLKIYKGDPKLLVTYGFTQKHARYIQMQQYLNVQTHNKYKFINLMDDIIDQKYAPILNKMILTYRNANISLVICLQYVKHLAKSNRANVNHTFVFGMNQAEDEKEVVNIILRPYFVAMGITDFDSMIKFYRAVTANHGFIYIDNIASKISFHRLDLSK